MRKEGLSRFALTSIPAGKINFGAAGPWAAGAGQRLRLSSCQSQGGDSKCRNRGWGREMPQQPGSSPLLLSGVSGLSWGGTPKFRGDLVSGYSCGSDTCAQPLHGTECLATPYWSFLFGYAAERYSCISRIWTDPLFLSTHLGAGGVFPSLK